MIKNNQDKEALIAFIVQEYQKSLDSGLIKKSCLLCEKNLGEDYYIAIMLMNREDMDLVGGPENKQKVCPYCLCSECLNVENKDILCRNKLIEIHHNEQEVIIDIGNEAPVDSPEKRLERMANRKKVSQ